MLIPKFLIALVIGIIGLLPVLIINPLSNIVYSTFSIADDWRINAFTGTLTNISIVSFILLAVTGFLFLLRRNLLKKKTVQYGSTWGCGYTAGTARQQYTSASFARNLDELAEPILHTKNEFASPGEEDIFPSNKSFISYPRDVFKTGVNRMVHYSVITLKRLARLQTGNVQHYILYAFVFILIIFILMFFNLI